MTQVQGQDTDTGADTGADVDTVAARVRAAWREVLHEPGTEREPDPDQGFLAAGGHSLAAARLVARLNGDLAVELPMSAILRDDPSFDQLVDLVTGQLGTRRADPARDGATGAAEPEPPAGSAPLSPTMRRIWTWHRLQPDSPAYNVVRVLEVAGRVQPSALRAALGDLAARHEALRCAVAEPRPGEPEVVVGDPVAVPLSVEVVRPGGDDPMTAVDEALYGIAGRPFAMSAPPLWRVGMVYVPPLGRTWLVLVLHHLVSDLRASDLVLADLATAYGARASGAAPGFCDPAPSLLAHLAHERRLVGTPRWEEHLAWWERRLSGVGPTTSLPLSAAERDEHAYAATTHSVELSPGESEALDLVLRDRRLTPAVFFLTAVSHVLAAWHGPDRVQVVGLPSVRVSRPEDERLVSFLLDTLLLPLSVDPGQDLLQAYDAVRDAFADATDHALPAFDDVVDRLRLPRTTRSPLVGLWFNDLTQADPPASLGDLPAVEYDLPPAWALFDLGLYLRRTTGGYRLHLVTPRGLGEPADTAALLDQVVALGSRAAAEPGRPLGELLEPPAARCAEGGTSRAEPTVDLVRRHARERPDAVAVADEDGGLDYRSLDAEVDALTEALRDAAEPGSRVAVPARRDRLFVLRLLACIRAGVTPVLVDATWPERRCRRALEIAAATHAFPDPGEGRPRTVGTVGTGATVDAGTPAHVLFTSGTTADPLAVRVSTPVAECALDDLAELLGVTAGDRVSMLSGPAHDPVLRDLGLALRTGATVCVPPAALLGNPVGLGSWLRQQRVSVVSVTPTLLTLALTGAEPLPDLRLVVCGGSPLSSATAALVRSRAPGAVVVNGYGCTETPQLVTAQVLDPGRPLPPTAQVPIGEPLAGRRVEVRTSEGRRCAAGQLGELWVAAPYLADGYLGAGAPGRFCADEEGVRWLRTGDLARSDAAGRLHLAGRADRQVLVNGSRVTLDEVESAARTCPGVTDVLAQLVGDADRQAVRLWAQRSDGAAVTEDAVRSRLATLLPASAVPARVVVVDRLELSENLKPVAPDQDPGACGSSAPDHRLHELAESMLGRPLDAATNFFDAGFTSITLLQLGAELAATLGHQVEPMSLFAHPNLSALSAHLFGTSADPRIQTPPAPTTDRTARVARMRSTRRQVRTWVTASTSSP